MVPLATPNYSSVFELARTLPNSAAFARLFDFHLGRPKCRVGPELAAKYGVAQDNSQSVLRISNRVTLQQAWFNEERTRKPLTWAAGDTDAAALDPTGGGGQSCDFCCWQTLTAEDTWGRVEGPHAVSASNLFKYVQPAQGVVMFKHHDPLSFSLPQLCDLVDVSRRWFEAAAASQAASDAALGLPRRKLHPLLVWNCLPRGGASQFHGHAQVMLSEAEFPTLQQEREAIEAYDYSGGSTGFYQDMLAAHSDCGLLVREGSEGDFAFAYAALAPWKDAEINVHGSSLASPAFQRLLHASLRALIDELGVRSFNASIHNIHVDSGSGSGSGASSAASAASVLDGPGNGAASSASSSSMGSASGGGGGGGMSGGGQVDARGRPVPVVARIVNRGKISSPSSDFGGLEVFGGASIGHTDPFRVAEALRKAQAAL